MNVERSSNFAAWTDSLIAKAKTADPRSLRIAQHVLDELEYLKALPGPPLETASLRRVRQSKKHVVWRLSHAYDTEVAVRVICWFDDVEEVAVVALFAADKLPMGDVFYDSVGSRADQIIQEWKRQQGRGSR